MSEKKPISAAEASKPEKKAVKKESGKKYFRANRNSGLKFAYNTQVEDPTLVKYVRFTPVNEKVAGYSEPKGYLVTEDPEVIARCQATGYVDEIDEKTYKNALKA